MTELTQPTQYSGPWWQNPADENIRKISGTADPKRFMGKCQKCEYMLPYARRPCKRTASCRIGCNNFCWQHSPYYRNYECIPGLARRRKQPKYVYAQNVPGYSQYRRT